MCTQHALTQLGKIFSNRFCHNWHRRQSLCVTRSSYLRRHAGENVSDGGRRRGVRKRGEAVLSMSATDRSAISRRSDFSSTPGHRISQQSRYGLDGWYYVEWNWKCRTLADEFHVQFGSYKFPFDVLISLLRKYQQDFVTFRCFSVHE